MGSSVVNPRPAHNDVIDWAAVSLAGTPSAILWDTVNRAPAPAAEVIRRELARRGEL